MKTLLVCDQLAHGQSVELRTPNGELRVSGYAVPDLPEPPSEAHDRPLPLPRDVSGPPSLPQPRPEPPAAHAADRGLPPAPAARKWSFSVTGSVSPRSTVDLLGELPGDAELSPGDVMAATTLAALPAGIILGGVDVVGMRQLRVRLGNVTDASVSISMGLSAARVG